MTFDMTDRMEEESEKLIELVRLNPVLYDKYDRNFKDSARKRDIWETIGYDVGMNGETAQKRWMNLRNAFNNYHKKLTCQSGDAAKKIKKYKYADIMQFLLPFLRQRETSSNLEVPCSFSEVSPAADSEPSASAQSQLESEGELESGEITKKASSIPPPKIPATRKRKELNMELDSFMLDYFKEKQEQNKEDDIDLFFKSMAFTVRKLPVGLQSEVKLQIHEIIHRAELKMLSEPTEP